MASTTRPNRSSFWRKDLVGAEAVIVLADVIVQGRIHFEPGKVRFSDAWDSALHERRDFLPVTDAVVTTLDGTALGEIPFMLVDRHDVVAAYPLLEAETSDPRARRLSRESVETSLITSRFRVDGRLHVSPDRARFSDAWESVLFDRRRFVPVTEATISDPAGRWSRTSDFVVVDKEDVIAVQPHGNGSVAPKTRPMPRTSVAAVLLLDAFRVTGDVHLEPGRSGFERFSDTWDVLMRDSRRCLPVTGVSIHAADGGEVVSSADLLVVDKKAIRAAFPASA